MPVVIERFSDGGVFAAAAEPFLVQHGAENNLLLGIIGFLRGEAVLGPDAAYLAVGRHRDAIVGVAIWTPGWRIVLSHPDHEEFGDAVGSAVRQSALAMRGVLATVGAGAAFSSHWTTSGTEVRTASSQPIYRLSRRPPVPGGPGHLREATLGDLETLVPWWQGFVREVDRREISSDEARAIAGDRIGHPDHATYVWQLDRVVSMALAAGPTPHGIRIAGVYTPPELRGRGYATACVAALSRLQMERGREFCFLFTDAANPTSNAIYRRIGYEQVAEVIALDFISPSAV